jgi:hypothetical protein
VRVLILFALGSLGGRIRCGKEEYRKCDAFTSWKLCLSITSNSWGAHTHHQPVKRRDGQGRPSGQRARRKTSFSFSRRHLRRCGGASIVRPRPAFFLSLTMFFMKALSLKTPSTDSRPCDQVRSQGLDHLSRAKAPRALIGLLERVQRNDAWRGMTHERASLSDVGGVNQPGCRISN